MRIIFVRHGEAEFNVNPIKENDNKGLTKRGKEQAKHLGNKLKEQNISEIYTSSLLRAKQTGEIISKIIKVLIKDNLRELDEYPGRILKSKLYTLANRRLKRLKRFLREVSREREEDKTILIVAHGITNRVIMSHFLEIPLKKQLLSFWQQNTCVNRIYWNSEVKKWRMDRMNDISHLPKNFVLE
ncbi:MAG: histidine phosphatase family protein [Candidatus Pacearchaeota archaeon]|nr:histidine phosphatase family protein [Candidatus Pacearchaeota archaeon]